jgi:hypothetical protein
MKKWGIFLKAISIAILLMIVRFLIDLFGLDMLSETNLIGCFIGGTLFVIALMLTGVLSDFKESEKIADDLPATIMSLFLYSKYIKTIDVNIVTSLQSHIKGFLSTLNLSFKLNKWDSKSLYSEIEVIAEDIILLRENGVEAQFITSLQSEVVNIVKMLNRIDTIKGTLFIPAGYIASYITTVISILLLLFIRIDSYYQGFIMVGTISLVLTFLIMLIHDMDNPFEVGKPSFADVDLSHLFDLEEILRQV